MSFLQDVIWGQDSAPDQQKKRVSLFDSDALKIFIKNNPNEFQKDGKPKILGSIWHFEFQGGYVFLNTLS